MYNLTVVNNYNADIGASNGTTVAKGGDSVFNDQGSMYLSIPGMGEMNFIDLGDKKIEGYPIPTQTWGALVRFCNVEAYYRYEGQGELTATFDAYGACTLTTANGSMIQISLEEFNIVSH